MRARAFMDKPFAEEAVELRRWHDAAKAAGKRTPDLAHFLGVVGQVMLAAGGSGSEPR